MASTPYEYGREDLEKLHVVGVGQEPWEAAWDEPSLASLRRAVKQHHMDHEMQRCVYCREEIRDEHAMHWNIDHIVPKSIAPNYTYFSKNLALCCWGCNQAKGAHDPRTGRAAKKGQYPSESGDYKAFHPYFDEWDAHFYKDAGSLLIIPRDSSKKAEVTIEVCQLIRIAARQAKLKMEFKTARSIERLSKLVTDENREMFAEIISALNDFSGTKDDFSALLRDMIAPVHDD